MQHCSRDIVSSFFFFSEKIRVDVSCDRQTIHMNVKSFVLFLLFVFLNKSNVVCCTSGSL